MHVRRAVAGILHGQSPDEAAAGALNEFFDRSATALGSLLFAGAAVPHSAPPPHVAQDYPDSPHFQPVHPRSYMDAYERGLLDLVNDLFHSLQRSHIRANQELEPQGIRYEVNSIPLPNLYHLTTTVPDMTVTVQIRDMHYPRRLPQHVRYRVSVGRAKANVSVRVLDPKIHMANPKVDFKLDPRTQEFKIRDFEDQLVPQLIERGRSAFRR